MKKRLTIHCEPYGKDIYTEENMTVMASMQTQLPALKAVCSGKGQCGKCIIRILDGKGSAVTQIERQHLGEKRITAGFRLACQVKALSNMSIYIPYFDSDVNEKKRQFEMNKNFVPEIETIKTFIPQQRRGRSPRPVSLSGIRAVLGIQNLVFPYNMLEKVRRSAEIGGEKGMTLTVNDKTVIAAEAGDTSDKCFGIAFDIGTTTVFAALCDLIAGEVIGIETTDNSQGKFGADVVSRIEYCCQDQKGTAVMQKMIISDMNGLIRTLVRKSGVESRSIYHVTVVGNPTMCHLLLGIKPDGLSKAPFTPFFNESLSLCSGELALATNSNAMITLLPGIDGFLGSDITAVAAVSEIGSLKGVTVAVDIGTNGEILAAKDGSIFACSAPAGPAFEGASIRCGLRAAAGAVGSVKLVGDDLAFETVDGDDPVGICGSGLIDLTALLLKLGIISPGGVMRSGDAAEVRLVPDKLRSRLFCEGGERGFRLFLGSGGEDVALYQKDIRELQLAKAAISAGIKTLLKQLNVGENDIDRVLLYGTFGSVINPVSAEVIGLIPKNTAVRTSSPGNGAGVGAVMALLSADFRKKTDDLAKGIKHINLSKNKDFFAFFAGEMLFPRV